MLTGSFSWPENIFWTNVPMSISASCTLRVHKVPCGMTKAIRPLEVASESAIESPRPLNCIRPLIVPVVPDSATPQPANSRPIGVGASRMSYFTALGRWRVSKTMSVATLPRDIAKLNGDSASRPRSRSSVSSMFEIGTRRDFTCRTVQRRSASKARIFSTGRSLSGSSFCGPDPVAAAAATAPFSSTMSGL